MTVAADPKAPWPHAPVDGYALNPSGVWVPINADVNGNLLVSAIITSQPADPLDTNLAEVGDAPVVAATAGVQEVGLRIKGSVAGDTPVAAVATFSDGIGPPSGSIGVMAVGYAFNNASFDRNRNNNEATIAASAARTATFTSADQTNYNGRGIRVSLDVTVLTATQTLTLEIDVKDPASGVYTAILTGAAVAAIGHVEYVVYPGILAVNNLNLDSALSRTWRVVVTAGNGLTYTMTIGSVTLL